MKKQYVADLAEGMAVHSHFVVRGKELRLARTGEGYLVLEFVDRTGAVGGVLFRPDRLSTELAVGSVVTVRGVLTSYRGRRRISVESLAPCPRYRREELVPGGSRDRRELLGEFKRTAAVIGDPAVRAVVREVFADRSFWARFLECPSSVDEDHPFIGGLLEHTVAVARACAALAVAHPEADADLLVAAALLHDVGKVDALSCDTVLRPTEEGRLLGHVVMGYEMVAAVSRPGLAAEKRARLGHAVLAHHEGPEGSGVEPVTLEALLLRDADRTDRSCSSFLLSTLAAARAEEAWTLPSRPSGLVKSVPGAPCR